MRPIALLCLLFGHALSGFAQNSKVFPERPHANDTLHLSYDNTMSATVFARITTYDQDGSVMKTHIPLTLEGGKLRGLYVIPPETASLHIDFYTLNKDDESASTDLLVYEHNRETPVKSAYLQSMFGDNPDSLFELEIKNHPTNYLAYAHFFNIVSMIRPADIASKRIDSLLDKLKSAQDPGLLAAWCIGKAKTGQLPEAKTYLFKLFRHYPQREETAFAFSIYNYEYYKATTHNIEPDVRDSIKPLFIAHPEAPLSGDPNVFYYMQADSSIPLSAFERVFKPRFAAFTLSYYALSELPYLYIQKGQCLDTARAVLETSIGYFREGTINHQFRLSYGHYQVYVAAMLEDLARVDLLQRDAQAAVIDASAAINVITGASEEGNLLPDLLQIRATAFEQSGNTNLAMEDYKRLYRSGTVTVLDSMRRLYPLSTTKQSTFAAFLDTLDKRRTAMSSSAETAAPDFSAKDMNGDQVTLSDLKGKIVVINIWGIGCGPCVAEMPELNELAARYQFRKDVVFLGVTGDNVTSLLAFLKRHPFHYRILHDAAKVGETFGSISLPMHIVIGKQGEIVSRSVGARPDISSYLEGVIERQL